VKAVSLLFVFAVKVKIDQVICLVIGQVFAFYFLHGLFPDQVITELSGQHQSLLIKLGTGLTESDYKDHFRDFS